MNERPLAGLLRRLRSAAAVEAAPSLGDAELLRRWVEARDEAAFEVLVWRHGPLVLGACRRLLSRGQDVEDAFQATFLVLVRKAATLRRGQAVGAWLYRVAFRVALRARAATAKRGETGCEVFDPPAQDREDELLWRDLRPVLDEEVYRLPERYRTPFVLCYLQGKTNAEAATELGCPVGTVLSRLSWARERLRGRLTKRGVALTGTLVAAMWTEHATAALSAVQVRPAVEAAVLTAAGKSAVGVVSAQAVSLMEGVLNAMTMTRWTIAAAVILASVLVFGTGSLALRSLAADEDKPRPMAKAPPAEDEKPPPEAKKERKKNWVDVPSPTDGILLFVGTGAKDSERLREGDKVERGQLLARLDDRKAVEAVRIAEAKLMAAKAGVTSATRGMEEARTRFQTLDALAKGTIKGVVAKEELRGAELTMVKYTQELEIRKADLAVAEVELRLAKLNVEMHAIQSPVRGTVQTIHLRPGEAVKRLEAVVRVRLVEE